MGSPMGSPVLASQSWGCILLRGRHDGRAVGAERGPATYFFLVPSTSSCSSCVVILSCACDRRCSRSGPTDRPG